MLNLIHLFDFYLALMLVASTYRRLEQYHHVARLVLAGPGRWPNLLKVVSQHRMILWTWKTLTPTLLWIVLLGCQLFASRVVYRTAEHELTFNRLLEIWPALIAVIPLGLAMVAFDLYTLYRVGQIDQAELRKHFDEAEYWLHSRTAHVVRVVTFGYINPRRVVAEEVAKALVAVSDMLNFALWWVILQLGLRLAFGLSLWAAWAVTRSNHA